MTEVAAPDFAGPIQGWRVWFAVDVEGQTRLASPVYHLLWKPGSAFVARCLRSQWLSRIAAGGGQAHAPPAELCSCGVYAASDLSLACAYLGDRLVPKSLAWPLLHRVLGSVALWGEVVECERGWRGSYAYPAQLYVCRRDGAGARVLPAEELVDELSGYRVPVELIEGGRPRDVREEVSSRLR